MCLKLCIVLLLMLQALFVLTANIKAKECNNAANKCTAKDPRIIYPKCMFHQKELSLWCDQSNYTRVPDPNKIYPDSSCRNASALYINDSCLEELHSDDLQKYPDMKCFKCGRNYITRLEANLFSGNNMLESIDFCRNKINFIQRGTFQGLANLKSLNLANNELDSVDSLTFIDLESLTEISFHKNKIAVLEQRSFFALKRLKILILTGNKISHIDEQAFDGLDELTHLHLDDNKLHELNSGTFVKLKKLEVLTVSYNKFVHWPQLDENSLSNVHTLNLAHNFLEEFTASNVANLSNLQNLSLGNNSLRVLPEDTFLNTLRLRYLDISHNNLEALGKYIFSTLCYLESVSLRKNKLQIPHPEWFANIVKNSNKEGNGVGVNPWNCDCDVVPYAEFLQTLDFSWSKSLRIQCYAPKKFKGQLLGSYALQNIKRGGHCAEQTYDKSKRQCNATPTFTRQTTLYIYSTTTEEDLTSISVRKTSEEAYDASMEKREFQSVPTEIAGAETELYLFILLGVVAVVVIAGVIIASKRGKPIQKSKSEGSTSTTSSSLSSDRSTDEQSGVYDKLQRENHVRISSRDSGGSEYGENNDLLTINPLGDRSIELVRIEASGDSSVASMHSRSDYVSMAPALSSEETLPKCHAADGMNDGRGQMQPTTPYRQTYRRDPVGGNC